jgi:release factor glutamine methyltransferase
MMVEHLFAEIRGELESFFEPLPDKPEETSETVLRSLWFAAAGTPLSATRVGGRTLPELEAGQVDVLRALLLRKKEGVPLAHLTGRQEFLGLELLASPEALIPRKETEILGRAALAALRSRPEDGGPLLAVDVCTGSGNLALAIAFHEPRARVTAADLSESAVALARRNAEFAGLGNRVAFAVGDLFAPLERQDLLGHCDLVSCNPPYISSARVPQMPREISRHEPAAAFDGGAYGVSILMRLLKDAPRFLKPGGALCFEVGLGQGPSMLKQVQRLPWVGHVEAHTDAAGAVRALTALRSGSPDGSPPPGSEGTP